MEINWLTQQYQLNLQLCIIQNNSLFGLGHIKWHGILHENKARDGKLKQTEVLRRHRKYKFLCAWRKCATHRFSGALILPISLNKRSNDWLYFLSTKCFFSAWEAITDPEAGWILTTDFWGKGTDLCYLFLRNTREKSSRETQTCRLSLSNHDFPRKTDPEIYDCIFFYRNHCDHETFGAHVN